MAEEPERDGQVTQLLVKIRTGDREAQSELARVLQRELQEVASRMLTHERPGHTMRPSDLVQEAFIQILGRTNNNWENRKHLVRSVSRMMRNILIDHARRYRTQKHNRPQQLELAVETVRGSGIPGLTANIGLAPEDLEKLLPIHEAIEALEREHPKQAEVIHLQVFGDLNDHEIAKLLDVDERTVSRYRQFARAWISRSLRRKA